MKKILLTTAAASLLSTSAFATENMFYVKADGGFSKFANTKVSEMKLKAGNTGFLGVGVGYYLMENIRFDLTYSHFFKPKYTFTTQEHSDAHAKLIKAERDAPGTSTAVALATYKTNNPTKLTQSLKHKITTNVDALIVNGMVDVFETNGFKASIGGGVGIAKVSSKAKFHANHLTLGKETGTAKAKSKTNLAFAAHLAGSYAVSEGVDIELAYSYRHFGKTNVYKAHKETVLKGYKLSSHNIGLGVRFEI